VDEIEISNIISEYFMYEKDVSRIQAGGVEFIEK
jgi:hypothetical protein